MVFKTLIAATCAAALAGSMVYFSTSPNGAGGSIKLDNAATEQVQAEKSAKKKPSILDRYVNPKKDKDTTEATDNPYKTVNSSDSDKPAVAKKPAKISKPVELEDSVQDKAKTQPKPATTKKLKEIDPAQMRINVVFKQAERISQPDLRDRAYLDLADYATNKGMFDQAKKAALRIKQVELRDTARSRIAMGMARYGMADEAFALIGKVEVKELRDVMRLQVIEALLGTDIRR